MIRDSLIDVLFCRTHLNLADFFTKSLEPSHFHSFKDLIMNTTPEMRESWREDGVRRQREREHEANENRRSRNRSLKPPDVPFGGMTRALIEGEFECSSFESQSG